MDYLPHDPDAYPFARDLFMSIPLVYGLPGISWDDLYDQKVVYTMILLRVFKNPIEELIQVSNCIFNPPWELFTMPTPGQVRGQFILRRHATLDEWRHMWTWQTLVPQDLPGMRDIYEILLRLNDYVCTRVVGGEGGLGHFDSFLGDIRNVIGFVTRAAQGCGIELLVREDLPRGV